MIVDVYIDDSLLDLFEGENLEVNSSIADIEDITKNTTDYTKTFTVPASKENNKLFKHYYNATIDNSFDARIKVEGRIELDGMLFRKGKFRLSKVSVKKGVPSSYTINFWGNLLDIKDTLGKDELSDLDLSAFDHSYDSANVKTGLTSSLFSGSVVYNLLAKKQYYYTSDTGDTFISDALANIGYGNGTGSNGVVWNDLRPSLKLIKIIEAIETDYNLTFSRDFFGRAEFNTLFLWLNSKKNEELGGDTQMVDFDGGATTWMNLTTNIGSYPVSNTDASNDNVHFKMEMLVTPASGFETVDYTVRFIRDGDVETEQTFTGEQRLDTSLNVQDASENPYTWNCYYEIKTSQDFQYTTRLKQRRKVSQVSETSEFTTSSLNTITSEFTTSDNLPKIKILDFLKGLFKMFKLVVIPQTDGTIYINTLKSYYAEGGVYDVTNYIDFESYDVERGQMLNEINFLFKEPQTILNKQFEENNRIAYGDQETKLTDDNGDILDGDSLEFTLPFEQVLFERLTDQNNASQTNIQYGAIVDEEIAPVNPKPLIHYNILQTLGSNTLGFINDSDVKESLSASVNTPSHTDVFEDPNFSTLFDSEFSTWSGQKINNTLYKNYHEDYILSIFNIKKRSFKYTAKNLPLLILLNLELNDVLKIKGDYYRINKFTSNLITKDVKFDLINSFDNTINGFSATPTVFYIDKAVQQVSAYVTNLGSFSYNKVDQGSGVAWVTVTSTTNNVFFTMTENTTGADRDIFIDLIQAVTLQEIRIYINQTGVFLPSLKFNDNRNSQNIIMI